MNCTIYKSERRANTYLYVASTLALKDLPLELMRKLGQLELVMTLVLTPTRLLAGADVLVVLKNLSTPGYYLQSPTKLDLREAEDGAG